MSPRVYSYREGGRVVFACERCALNTLTTTYPDGTEWTWRLSVVLGYAALEDRPPAVVLAHLERHAGRQRKVG